VDGSRGIYLPAPESQSDLVTHGKALGLEAFAADLRFQRFAGQLAFGTQFQSHDRSDHPHRQHGCRPAGRRRPHFNLVGPNERNVPPAIRAGHAIHRDIERPHIGAALAHLHRQLIDLPQEAMHKNGGRNIVDLAGDTGLFDSPLIEHDDGIRHLNRFLLIMGHEYAREMQFVMQTSQPSPQFMAHLAVESAKRFVQQQHVGIDGECPCEGHALPLAARQLRRIAIARPA